MFSQDAAKDWSKRKEFFVEGGFPSFGEESPSGAHRLELPGILQKPWISGLFPAVNNAGGMVGMLRFLLFPCPS
jgi:hypothetical protein